MKCKSLYLALGAESKSYSMVNNSPDNFLNGFTRPSGLTVPGSRYFFKVSPTPDFDNKILSTVESGFEAQNLLKFCPEYCFNALSFDLVVESHHNHWQPLSSQYED